MSAHLSRRVRMTPATLRQRLQFTSACTMPHKLRPRFSKGADESALAEAVESLIMPSAQAPWSLAQGGEALQRSFHFKTFSRTWDFMTAVSLQCKLHNHHPEWSNVYNITHIRWTTHKPQGLSEKDVTMAAICDALARDFGEVVTAKSEAIDSNGPAATPLRGSLESLTDAAAKSAGNCCGRG